ncbi:hypothetical protein [Blastopirellula marina]|uniref:Uncharacterized protein n=1 Tax=Blastopirellula marina TaxID=124 RepID=A0A2S8GFW1_9BACT|nr:hypothetical protein [Blastopirellula marina]PQO43141.1 hypothetical protein C5Y93_25895 [Blastopirellula marina]
MPEQAERKRPLVRGERLSILIVLLGALALYDLLTPILALFFADVYWQWLAVLGLFVVQFDLLAIWIALGPGLAAIRILWGVVGCLAITVCCSAGVAFAPSAFGFVPAELHLPLILLTAATMSFGMLLFHGGTTKTLDDCYAPGSNSTRLRLRHLFSATAALCASLAMLMGVKLPFSAFDPSRIWLLLPVGIFVGVMMSTSVPVLLAAYQPEEEMEGQPLWIGAICLIASGWPAALALFILPSPAAAGYLFVGLLSLHAAHGCGLALALSLVRHAGYDLRVMYDAVGREPVVAAPVELDPWSEEDSQTC